jgi:hypothetical protein
MVRLAYVLNQPMFSGLLEQARPLVWWSGMFFLFKTGGRNRGYRLKVWHDKGSQNSSRENSWMKVLICAKVRACNHRTLK